MAVTHSDFDPLLLERYTEPPKHLHFQWDGKQAGDFVYKYKLIEKIEPHKIDPRSKELKDGKNKV